MDCKDWQLICCYTRQKALDDGVLVDVSDFVSDFGFIVPVAVTATLFNSYILPSAKLVESGQTSESRMVSWLFEKVATPILFLIGEPGSGKTTLASALKGVFDPTENGGAYLPETMGAIGV